MKIKYLRQPPFSSVCGAYAVAMATGAKPEKILEIIGHERGTIAKELIHVIQQLGFVVPKQPRRLTKNTVLPANCLLRIRWDRPSKKIKGHWVFFSEGVVYDSGNYKCAGVVDFINFSNCIQNVGRGKIVSYLEVQSPIK